MMLFKIKEAFSGFSVHDISAAKSFYQEQLGLIVKENKMGLLELHGLGGNPIIVYPKPNHQPATFTVLNFPVENIETTVKKLQERGVKFEQYEGEIATDELGICRADGGPNIAWFKDPAGNILSILETKK